MNGETTSKFSQLMNTLSIFRNIKTFIFDVDGVLTNSDILVSEDGSLLRTMNTRDGYALKAAIEQGYNVIIITGGGSAGVVKRLKNLGILHIYSKVKDKLSQYQDILAKLDLNMDEVLYMGDDLVDYQVMKQVGLPTCPIDAVPEIVSISKFICSKEGGKGCVREIIEKVLKLNNHWPSQHF